MLLSTLALAAFSLTALAAPNAPHAQHHLAAGAAPARLTAPEYLSVPVPDTSSPVLIRPSHTPSLCLTDPFLPDNYVKLAWEPCLPPTDALAWSQRFVFPGITGGSAIRLAESDVCLDSGNEPANGARVVLYQCEETPDQVWTFWEGHICSIDGFCLSWDEGDDRVTLVKEREGGMGIQMEVDPDTEVFH